jgi:hypothetical protein
VSSSWTHRDSGPGGQPGSKLDCDVLATQRGDLWAVTYTARPDGDTQTKLDLLAAIGTQTMTTPRG